MLPKVMTQDLPGALDWIRRFVSQVEREGLEASATAEAYASGESSGSASGGGIPVGAALRHYAGDPPAEWTLMDGGLRWEIEDALLFAAIGYNYSPQGVDPPAGTFFLPAPPDGETWIIRRL